MTRFWNASRGGYLVAALLVVLTVSPAVLADDHGGEPEHNSALSFSAGVDLSTAYYYNGIPQQDAGVITWPWAEFGIQLTETIGVSFGTWNSLHDQQSGNPWYESDFYTGISVGLPANLEFGLTYVYLYNPNGGDKFSEELQFSLSYDDSELLGDMALSPSVQISQEIEAGSDAPGAAGREGTLLLISIEPGLTLMDDSDYPLSLSFPGVVGINLDDYYETGLSAGPREDNDDTFGFADIGVAASVPLAFVPEQYGSWSFGASFHVIFLGDSAQEIGGPDNFGVSHDFSDVEVYATGGITVEM